MHYLDVWGQLAYVYLLHFSVVWSGFCTASDINKLDRFLARCKRHNYCNQTMYQASPNNFLFDNADQPLFRTVLYMHNHVMHRLLPPKKRLQYKCLATTT